MLFVCSALHPVRRAQGSGVHKAYRGDAPVSCGISLFVLSLLSWQTHPSPSQIRGGLLLSRFYYSDFVLLLVSQFANPGEDFWEKEAQTLELRGG